jgi:hypothetical protein
VIQPAVLKTRMCDSARLKHLFGKLPSLNLGTCVNPIPVTLETRQS